MTCEHLKGGGAKGEGGGGRRRRRGDGSIFQTPKMTAWLNFPRPLHPLKSGSGPRGDEDKGRAGERRKGGGRIKRPFYFFNLADDYSLTEN